jgi:hypothetical protein
VLGFEIYQATRHVPFDNFPTVIQAGDELVGVAGIVAG